jgi:glycosyltransferase 2 family protein
LRDDRAPLLHRLGDAASELGRTPPQRVGLRLLLQVGLTALVLGFLIYTVASNWRELAEEDVRFEAGWFALSLPFLVGYLVATGFGWTWQLRMLSRVGSRARTQMAWGKSLLARYVPGGILFVVTRVILSEREGIPRRVTVTAMVYETGLQFASGSLVAAWVLFAHPGRTGTALAWLAVAGAVAALVCMHPRLIVPVLNLALRTLGRREVAAEFLRPGQVLILFLYYLATWALMGAAMICIAKAVYAVDPSDWISVASAQALAFCAALMSLVFPGGLGIRDGAFAWALRPVLPGDSFAIGAAIALVARIGLALSEALYVAFAVAIGRRVPGPSSEGERPELAGSEAPGPLVDREKATSGLRA